jgi:flagellar hook-associated protein 1 FlgK
MSDMGLAAAASGLAADSALLATASNNLANVSTPGYSTQVVNLSPEPAAGFLGVGQGVMVGSVTQLTNAVLSAANVVSQGIQGAATQTSQVMDSVQSVFPEPSTTGISSQLSTLWSDLSTLATNPNQAAAGQAVVGAAQSLASSISASYSQLSNLSSSLQSQVGSGTRDGATLAQVNVLLAQVAQLNSGIAAGSAGGQNPNALTDQGTAAVNQLATLLGVSSSTSANGSITVQLKGVQLVGGDIAQTLSSTGSAATQNLSIVTANGVTIQAGGSIGANLSAVNTTIPDYQARLDAVADSLATNLNSLQANGINSLGDPGSTVAGAWAGTVLPNIFVNGGSPSTYSAGTNSAATLSVSAALLANPTLLASAAAPGAGNSNVIGSATFDGTNAQAMAALASLSTGPDALYASMVGALGTQTANATAASTTATQMATSAASNLSSSSGVNQNNQEVAILSAQNAFQASSKLVSAITTCFQSLLAAV